MAEAVSCWQLTAQAAADDSLRRICDGGIGTETDFWLNTSVFPVIIVPPMLSAHSSVPVTV
jgi:hypothetical protein